MSLNFSKIYHLFKDYYNPFGEKGIIFIHVPKCGGTSISHAIRSKSILSHIHLKANESIKCVKIVDGIDDHIANFNIIDNYRSKLLLYYTFMEYKYIYGHFKFNYNVYVNTYNKYDYVTLLRDPVERFISKYYYIGINESLDEFIYSNRAKEWGKEFISYFQGDSNNTLKDIDQSIEMAINNLKKFKIVGQLKDIPSFQKEFEIKYGKKIKVKKLNKGRKKEVGNKLRRSIENICKPDLELYNSI